MTAVSGRRDRLNQLALLEGAAMLALAGAIWRYGSTGPIPMHLGWQGRVDVWGGRVDAALALVGLTVLLGLGYLLLAAMSHGQPDDSPTLRGLSFGRIILMLVGVLIAAMAGWAAFGDFAPGQSEAGVARPLTVMLSVIFLVTGMLIGKAAPNPVVGIRTYWALKSRLAWDKSNRLAGRLFFWIGLLGLVAAPLAPAAEETAALVIAALGAAALAVIESWRVWRTDPDRSFP